MNKQWLILVMGSFFEVLWVIGMKHSANGLQVFLTLLAIVISFYALIYASKTLPVGTAYAVFVGLGTAGTILVGCICYGEAIGWAKIGLIALLLAGVVGLKLVTTTEGEN
ncbi:DMT family transporter [Enterococcus sp. LJL99]